MTAKDARRSRLDWPGMPRRSRAQAESRVVATAPTPTRSPKHCASQRLTVRCSCEGDAGVGVQVIDVVRPDQTMHRSIDRRRSAPAPVQAEVEIRDHVVFVLNPAIDADHRPKPIQPEHRKTLLGQCAEIAPRSLDPQQLDRAAGHRIDFVALSGRVSAGVVRHSRIRTEPVAARDKSSNLRRAVCRAFCHQAPQPAAWPPMRSAAVFSA